MKYTFTAAICSNRGIEHIEFDYVGLPNKTYTFQPIGCIPNDSIVLGVSANDTGVVINYEQLHNINKTIDFCCSVAEPIISDNPLEPTPTPLPVASHLPLAPYDLNITLGSVVFGWFHNNAPPYTAEQFDVYRRLGVDGKWEWVKSIYARGTGIRVYSIRDDNYVCGSVYQYRVAASNSLGRTFSDIVNAVVETCTPTPTPSPTDRTVEYDLCFTTPTPTPTPTPTYVADEFDLCVLTPTPTPTPTDWYRGVWFMQHYEHNNIVCHADALWQVLSPEGTDPDDEPGVSIHWRYIEPFICPTPTPTAQVVEYDLCNPTPTPTPTAQVVEYEPCVPTPTPTPTPTHLADEFEMCDIPVDIPPLEN